MALVLQQFFTVISALFGQQKESSEFMHYIEDLELGPIFEAFGQEFFTLPFIFQISLLLNVALLCIIFYDHFLAFGPHNERALMRPLRRFLHRLAVIIAMFLATLHYGLGGLFSALSMLFLAYRFYHLLVVLHVCHFVILYMSYAHSLVKNNKSYLWF